MTGCVQLIDIQNFKAFRDFELKLEGRNLLLYGENGSGKSSLYWALYTILQSARKETAAVSRYFEPSNPDNLLNIYEDERLKAGEISLSISDPATSDVSTFRISKNEHGSKGQPIMLKGELASDFVTYRFFFGFFHFGTAKTFDLWPLFEEEILPSCVSTSSSSATPFELWQQVKSGDPNPLRMRGLGGTYAYDRFKHRTEMFATVLAEITERISNEAQAFYDKHFSEDDTAKINLKLGLTRKPAYEFHNRRFLRPVMEFGLQVDGSEKKPQIFLNEAKLTQLALSVRFGASLVNLYESDLKLLVLDDLLVSLDMSNRMKFVEIILGDAFASHQKIILTHDLGFFREFQRMIGDGHGDWCFRTLIGNARDGISAPDEKSSLEKAQDYINGHSLEEAALHLRKSAEETAKKYRRFAMKESPRPGKFHSLSEDLKAARNHLNGKLSMTLYHKVIRDMPEEHRAKLVSTTDADIDSDATLDAAIKKRIKFQRKQMKNFLSQTAWQHVKTIETIDAVIRMKDRVLNPAAHWGETPLFEAELRKAMKLIDHLEKHLK